MPPRTNSAQNYHVFNVSSNVIPAKSSNRKVLTSNKRRKIFHVEPEEDEEREGEELEEPVIRSKGKGDDDERRKAIDKKRLEVMKEAMDKVCEDEVLDYEVMVWLS
jgi:hypothetical protein